MKSILSAFVFSLSLVMAFGQSEPDTLLYPTIVVYGKVTNSRGFPISNAMLINKNAYQGTFGNNDGTFRFEMFKKDTLQVGALGYHTQYFGFEPTSPDSVEIAVQMKRLSVDLAAAEVFAPRDLKAIKRDIDKLGYDKKDYVTSGINAFESPISFLYYQFSRREQGRRKAIELTNSDNRRALLKELFERYVSLDIIDLQNDQFDDFVDYIGVTDQFLQQTSQYDFVLFVKERYREFKKIYHIEKIDDSDYNYDED